jgi:hypothetical protein
MDWGFVDLTDASIRDLWGVTESSPSNTLVTIATEPAGFYVTIVGSLHEEPYSFSMPEGAAVEIGVVSPQQYKGKDYYFVEWSDGGEETHFATVPDADVTFTAYFSDVITGDEDGRPPLVNALYQNNPNPFNPSTTLRFSLEGRGPVSLTVYDVAGRLVDVLVDEVMDAGPHEVVWDGLDKAGRAVASGIYMYRLEAGEFKETRKMVLIR